MKLPLGRRVLTLLALVALSANGSSAAQAPSATQAVPDRFADGPYLATDAACAGWLALRIDDGQARRRCVAKRGVERIAAVGNVPAFDVPVRRLPNVPDRAELPIGRDVPLFVVADTHGEYEILVELLRAQRIVDRRLGWSYGRGHLVVLGDMFDRGAHQTEILWLLYKLEAEARRAGGGVHVVLGNHELMILKGDLRYLHPGYARAAQLLDRPFPRLYGPDTVLGAWLRGKPVLLKLGRDLYAHGGVSPKAAEQGLSVGQVNAAFRAALDRLSSGGQSPDATGTLITGPDGPLWYRGYFALDDRGAAARADEVRRLLDSYRTDRILVGHTPVDRVHLRYGGKVVAVQVYPHRDDQGAARIGAVRRMNGRWSIANADGSRAALTEEAGADDR